MKAHKTLAPATVFAAGLIAAPAHAATTVDISASPSGTAINLAGSDAFYFEGNDGGSNYIEAAWKSGNTVGTAMPAAYYPTSSTASLNKTQYTSADGYYGVMFAANGQEYTGWLDVDQNGTHISALDYHLVSASAVPEPAAWALMILGMGVAGAALRQRRQENTLTA